MTVSMPQQDQEATRPTSPTRGGTATGGGWSITITPRTLWLAAGIVALAVGLWFLISKGIYVFILLFISIILAEGVRPIMNYLHRRWRLPEPAAVFVIFLGILLIFLFLGWLLIQPLAGQIASFATDLPRFGTQLGKLFGQLQRWLGNNPQIGAALAGLQSQAGALLQGLLPLLLGLPLLVGRFVFSAVVVVVMTFFWLTGIERLRPFFVGLFPADHQPLLDDVLADISHRIGGYLRGVVVNMAVIGVLSGLGDWLLGVPYAILLGIIAGLTELIPFFGPWISGAVAIVVAGVFVDPLKAIEVVGFYIVIQELEGNTLVPLVMMTTVDLNPLTVIVAVLLGTEMLGIVGGVLAVPAAAVLKVVIVRILAPVARSAAARAAPPTPATQPDRPANPPPRRRS